MKAIPDPVPGRVRSRLTSYAGAGFADTLFRAGAFALPLVPGIEVAGRVRAAGPGVEGFAPGHRVGALLNDFGRSPRAGGYAELAVAHASMAARIPAGLDSAIAASAVVNAVTVWVALRELARVGPRDRVAVFTPGGVAEPEHRAAGVPADAGRGASGYYGAKRHHLDPVHGRIRQPGTSAPIRASTEQCLTVPQAAPFRPVRPPTPT